MNLRYVVKELYQQKRRTVIAILGFSIGIALRHGELFNGQKAGEKETGRYLKTALNSWSLCRPDTSGHRTFNRMEHEQNIL
jgi:hypothetical protein